MCSLDDLPTSNRRLPARPGDLSLGRLSIRSRVFLAPLSGITDVPFRRLVRSFGTEVVYSEMVASGELIRNDADSRQRAGADGLGLHAVQLAGREASAMRRAAEIVAAEGADVIDINMGCPAKKVVGGLSGSALMRDLDQALRLIEATVAGAGSVPVTLKMRLGWDRSSLNAPDLAVRAEGAGVRLVTVHGRTRDQFYTGAADWPAIAAVSRAVSIPVVANGDLQSMADLDAMLQASEADAAMIGRGACGRPWFPALVGGHIDRDRMRQGFADLVVAHYDSMLEFYGEQAGLRHARKHLGWYLDRWEAAAGLRLMADRAELMRATDSELVRARLRSLFGATTLSDVEPDLPASLRQAA
ncbi:tRNA dihydrouridine synthase DusB [uncultured Aureimonas sp.]|uniref:tRNA dihydrouridine synthase DusB n=1 Tax=uncultured Aureimonas sp. TaxID=1604662 RepID=UPI0025CCB662|nr:tRNA dihydrouridine synthase DusB [uncultured Aureimonas sp.]